MLKEHSSERRIHLQWNTFEEYVRASLPLANQGEDTPERNVLELMTIVNKLSQLNIWNFSFTFVTNQPFSLHPLLRYIQRNSIEYRLSELDNTSLTVSNRFVRDDTDETIVKNIFSHIRKDNKRLTQVLKRYMTDRKTIRDIIAEELSHIQTQIHTLKSDQTETFSPVMIQAYVGNSLRMLSQNMVNGVYVPTHPNIIKEFHEPCMPHSMAVAFSKEVDTAIRTINKFLFSRIAGYAQVHLGEYPYQVQQIIHETVPDRSKFSSLEGSMLPVNHHTTCPAIKTAEQFATFLAHEAILHWQQHSIEEF